MPKGWGFGLILFSYGQSGFASWISDCTREDMMKAMEELLARWKKNEPSI